MEDNYKLAIEMAIELNAAYLAADKLRRDAQTAYQGSAAAVLLMNPEYQEACRLAREASQHAEILYEEYNRVQEDARRLNEEAFRIMHEIKDGAGLIHLSTVAF